MAVISIEVLWWTVLMLSSVSDKSPVTYLKSSVVKWVWQPANSSCNSYYDRYSAGISYLSHPFLRHDYLQHGLHNRWHTQVYCACRFLMAFDVIHAFLLWNVFWCCLLDFFFRMWQQQTMITVGLDSQCRIALSTIVLLKLSFVRFANIHSSGYVNHLFPFLKVLEQFSAEFI